MSTKTLKLEQLRIDGGTQMRVSLSEATVKEYCEAYQESIELPPIRAVYDGSEYWLVDGFTRWHARKRAGLNDIEVEITNGTQRDAILLACGANASHGLKRTNDDKRKSVETLLRDEEWGKWSDNKIAEATGVNQSTVSRIRSQLMQCISSSNETDEKRLGRDGKMRPAKNRKQEPKATEKSPKEQLREFFGQRSDDSEKVVYGFCPNCKGKKWTTDESGVSCAKCNHPHGEALGDADEDRIKTQRSKTIKTAEALMRGFDDLQEMKPSSKHGTAIEGCKNLLAIAKEWK